jgi:dihydroflavonol-4-reductase
MVTVSNEFNKKLYDINVGGTRNILVKCLEHNVKKLVYVSSTSAIPELLHGQVIREVSRFDPEAVIGYYGQTKAEASQLVMDTFKNTGLDASIVFPSGICGPNDYAYGYYSNAIMDIAAEKMPVGIAGSFNAVDVRDLAEGIIACVEKGRKGEGYILSNNIVTIDDIFELVTKYTGAKRVKTILPLPVARTIALFSEIYGEIAHKQVTLTSFALYNLARNNSFSSAKAIQELGYSTRSFDETIRDTIDWLVAEGKIVPKTTRLSAEYHPA